MVFNILLILHLIQKFNNVLCIMYMRNFKFSLFLMINLQSLFVDEWMSEWVNVCYQQICTINYALKHSLLKKSPSFYSLHDQPLSIRSLPLYSCICISAYLTAILNTKKYFLKMIIYKKKVCQKKVFRSF